MSILWNPNEAVELIEMPLPLITEGTQDMGNGVYWLKAGTPLDEYFAVANDETAVYLVAEDFYFYSNKADQAKVVPLIAAGYVDINKAEQSAGITYSQDCIDALAHGGMGIVLVDGTLPSSGGGGGGGDSAPVVYFTIGWDQEAEKTIYEAHSDVPFATLLERVVASVDAAPQPVFGYVDFTWSSRVVPDGNDSDKIAFQFLMLNTFSGYEGFIGLELVWDGTSVTDTRVYINATQARV